MTSSGDLLCPGTEPAFVSISFMQVDSLPLSHVGSFYILTSVSLLIFILHYKVKKGRCENAVFSVYVLYVFAPGQVSILFLFKIKSQK